MIKKSIFLIIATIFITQNIFGATINLEFFNEKGLTSPSYTQTCTVDGTIGTLPEAPRKPGYKFIGWKVKNLCGIDKFTEEQKALNGFANYGYNWIVNNGSYCYYWDNGSYGTYSCSDTPDLETNGDWMAKFDYGTIYGEANCSPQGNGETYVFAETTKPMAELSKTNTGMDCWCRIAKFEPKDINGQVGRKCTVSFSSWVYNTTRGTSNNPCGKLCANICASSVRLDEVFRKSLFNAVINGQ